MARTPDAIEVADDPHPARLNNEPTNTAEPLSGADRQAFLASAGSWSGIVDVEQFKADNAESRRISPRPPVSV